MRITPIVLFVSVSVFLEPQPESAEAPNTQGSGANAAPCKSIYASPEIHADRTMTFRLYAPNAKQVEVGGGFGRPGQVLKSDFGKMARDSNGIWSTTIGPLEHDIYKLWVDGLGVLDERNEWTDVNGGHLCK